MGRITPDMKVARLVERHPETVDVFLAYGCPDMRRGFFRVMARLMSVRSAARMHRIPLDELMTDLGNTVETLTPGPCIRDANPDPRDGTR